MNEQMDKQEPATPFKLEEARRKGQVGRSAELVGFAMLATMLAGLLGVMPALARALSTNVTWWIANAPMLATDGFALRRHGARIAETAIGDFLVPVLCAALIVTVAVAIAHGGAALSFIPLQPDINRINPSSGFKRIFSLRNAVELAKLLVKLALFATAFYLVWPALFGGAAVTLNDTPSEAAAHWLDAARRLIQAFLVVFALSALFDLWFSKREFARQMRMSRRDLKDEHKRREGDPEIKSKRRRNQLEFIKRLTSLARVKDSDVIVTNPTHVAVALRYRPGETPLPITVALGRGFMAQALLALARRHRIPILRRPPLARALARRGSPGAPIGPDRQHDVAEVYRWVIALPGNRVLR